MIEGLSDATAHAMITELCSGRKFLEENCKFRETHAAQDAFASRGHKTSKALGKKVLSLPAYDFFRLQHALGEEAMHDRSTIRDIQRLAPEFKVYSV